MAKKKKKEQKVYQKKETQKEIVVRVEQNAQQYLTLILIFFIMLLFGVIMYMMIGSENNATGAVIGVATDETVEVQKEHYVSEREIEVLLNTSAKTVEEMREEGLNTLYVQDLLIEMQDEANDYNINYNKLLENAQLILEAKEDALYVRDLLILKENEIREYERVSGFDAQAAWSLYNKAKEEFGYERYSNAKDFLMQITQTLDQITVDQTRLQTRVFAQTNRVWEWIKNNAISIAITLIIIALIIAVSYKQMQLILLRRRINHLMIEEEVLVGLMKKAQKEYYQDKKITKSMYAMKMEMYSSRIEEIKALLPVLQKELQKKRKERIEAITARTEERVLLHDEKKKPLNVANMLPQIEKKAVSKTKRVKKSITKKMVKKKEKKEAKKKEEKVKRRSTKKESISQIKTGSPLEIEETVTSLEEEFGEETKEQRKEEEEKKEIEQK